MIGVVITPSLVDDGSHRICLGGWKWANSVVSLDIVIVRSLVTGKGHNR